MPTKLKKRVHARMEKTGESYQTALRQVRAQADGTDAKDAVGSAKGAPPGSAPTGGGDLGDHGRRALDALVRLFLDGRNMTVETLAVRHALRDLPKGATESALASLVPNFAEEPSGPGTGHYRPTFLGLLTSDLAQQIRLFLKRFLAATHLKFEREGAFHQLKWRDVKSALAAERPSLTDADLQRMIATTIVVWPRMWRGHFGAPDEHVWARPDDLTEILDENIRTADGLLALRHPPLVPAQPLPAQRPGTEDNHRQPGAAPHGAHSTNANRVNQPSGSVSVVAGDDGGGNILLNETTVAAGTSPSGGGDVLVKAGDGGPNGPGGSITVVGGSITAGSAGLEPDGSPPESVASTEHIDVLLMVATDVERDAVLEAAPKPHSGRAFQLHHGEGRTYHELGKIAGATVALVQCEQGTGSVGGSIATAITAILERRPATILMVGIAFGIDEARQPVGTILISQQIEQYERQRIGTAGGLHEIRMRGDRATATPRVLSRLRAAAPGQRVQVGLLLSGEKLVDDIDYRNTLLSMAPDAIGGEMEGGGLYAAATERGVEWCVVKAVCDYADGNKAKDKKERQTLAAKAAAEFVIRTLRNGGFGRTSSTTGNSRD